MGNSALLFGKYSEVGTKLDLAMQKEFSLLRFGFLYLHSTNKYSI